jgi:hypothetical protein
MKKLIENPALIMSILFLAFVGCASTDVDRSADFTQYRTFNWGDARSEFARRGIVHRKRNPDFVVSFQTVTAEKEQQTGGAWPYYYGLRSPFAFYRFGFGYPMWAPGWGPGPSIYTYTEGTLIIDVTDIKTDELVWRGSISGNVDNVGGLQKQLDKAVKAIMKKYPVKPENALSPKGAKENS